jgi:hypothetical protein
MGNRAVITNFEHRIGVYLHWNGGRDSVEAFLKYCELKGYRSPDSDCYGWASLVTVISNFFGSGRSVGIDVLAKLDTDNGDNGLYIIKGWQIVGRSFLRNNEQREHGLIEALRSIDETQPKNSQIPEKINEFEKSMMEVEK